MIRMFIAPSADRGKNHRPTLYRIPDKMSSTSCENNKVLSDCRFIPVLLYRFRCVKFSAFSFVQCLCFR